MDTPPSLPPEVSADLRSILRAPGERYAKTERLGAGGMGEVWKAWDSDLSRWVALKFLRDEALGQRARFEREAQTVARLNHPGIAAVYGTGVLEGRPFIAMQFVAGPTLQNFPRSDRRLLVELVRDAAAAIHHAHREGVVHRDLKPSNLMVETPAGAKPRVYVMDFGLAKQADADATLSVTGVVVGTPTYMSPEQATGRRHDVGPRSDVYSLGATLYELLTGRPPFGGTPAEVLHAVEYSEAARPAVERDLATIVMHCLEKDPARRYPSAQALAEDLDRWLRGESIVARPPSLPYRLSMFLRRRKTVVAATLAGVAVTLAAVGVPWYVARGTINVSVHPAGARVSCGSESWTAPAEIRLGAGVHILRMEAPDHDAETREVLVERGRSKDLAVTLRHHRGALEADARPAGAEIEIAGVTLGSRARNFAIDTGPYRVRAWAPGCFEQEREITVRRGETARVSFSLDDGIVWSELSGDQRLVNLLPDLDGDGAIEIGHTMVGELIIRSGRTHEELWRVPGPSNPAWYWRSFGRDVLIGTDEATGPLVWRVRLGERGRHETLWTWRAPVQAQNGTAYPTWAVGDKTIALCDRDRQLWFLDAATGTPRGAAVPLDAPVTGLTFDGDDAIYWGEALRCGRVTPDGRVLWRTEVKDASLVVDMDITRDKVTDLIWRTDAEMGIVDGATGASVVRGVFRGPAAWAAVVWFNCWPEFAGLGRDGHLELVRAQDGSLIWSTSVADLGPPVTHYTLAGWSTGLLVALRDGVTLLDRNGRREWTMRGRVTSCWGDERIYVTVAGVGVKCLDQAGRILWTLRLPQEGAIQSLLPDADGDGQPEILLTSYAAWTAFVRGPRALWRVSETPPIQATPAVTDTDGDGVPEVLLLSHVAGEPNRSRVICYEGATGTPRWEREIVAARTRAFAVGDWDGDGKPDLAHSGARSTTGFVAIVLRGRDGAELFRSVHAAPASCDSYCVGAVVDLNGDGARDFVTHRWHASDVWAVNGRTGEQLWRHATQAPNAGGVAVADLDRDGKPDVIAPSTDGRVYALRGHDARILWAAATGPSRVPPTLADLTGDGTEDVVVIASAGLRVVDGRSGEVVWTADGHDGAGRASVVRSGGRTFIVAPLGRDGAAVFDWERRERLWSGPEGRTVQASPAVADLDGDGTLEIVVAGTRGKDGDVVVADLVTGRILWRIPLGPYPIEADPVVADLNGDGVQDIVVATHEGVVHALDGRATVATRQNR